MHKQVASMSLLGRTCASCAAFLLCAAASPADMLRGTYAADCAPYDGAAFRIILPARNGRQIELAANAPLSEMAATWTHGGGNSRPGTATILDCRTAPDRVCSYPETGTFTIIGKSGGAISGTFTATFAGGDRQTRRFAASPQRGGGTMVCG